jgi:8-oxo-dGTP pyrophosphatase MutT (NUDIX family)
MPQITTRLLDFDSHRAPVPPRDAATVIVLRDGDEGIFVFCVLRHAKSGFLGGAVVFPGGKVDASDTSLTWNTLASDPHPRASELGIETVSARALAVAACRETLEEAGILPTSGAPLAAEEVELIREDVRLARSSLADALAVRGRKLALDALVPWARWITPEAESRRFDARFFLLALPEGQVGRHDEHETTLSFWATPKDVLDRFVRGEIFLAPPTTRALELLNSVPNVLKAMEIAEQQSLRPICPRFLPGDGGAPPYLALPGDPSHEVRERRVDGPTRFVLQDGIFVSAAETLASSPKGARPEPERA